MSIPMRLLKVVLSWMILGVFVLIAVPLMALFVLVDEFFKEGG